MVSSSKHGKFCTIEFGTKEQKLKALGLLIHGDANFRVKDINVYVVEKKDCQRLEKKKVKYMHLNKF